MTAKHMPPTQVEVREDTENLFMVTMRVLTTGAPNTQAERTHNPGWKELFDACLDNDRRWMNPQYPVGPLRTLDTAHWRRLTRECTYDI